MRALMIPAMAVCILAGSALAPSADAAGSAAVAPLQTDRASPLVQPVDYYWHGARWRYRWRGGYYAYRWRGGYYRHRRWWHGYWRYY